VTPPVLVTGGTGFVGGALLGRLVADGRDVRALVRDHAGAALVSAAGATPITGHLGDAEALRAAAEGCGTVFHAAGVNAMCLRDPGELFRTNVGGSERMIRAAAAAGVSRIVYTSSAATIGEPEGIVGREDTPHRGSFLSAYERSKFEAEQRVRDVAASIGVAVTIVNPSSVQGPGRTRGTARLLLALLNGRLPAVVPTFLSIVDVDDCTLGHLLAERGGADGERYVLSGSSLSVSDAVDLLRRVTGRPRRVLVLPRASARAAGAVADRIARLSGGRTRACPELVRTLLHGHRFDGSRATRELGLAYRPLEDTVRRTIAWYASQGLLRRS
jgi:dihydroflavonol-4-reductase